MPVLVFLYTWPGVLVTLAVLLAATGCHPAFWRLWRRWRRHE